MVFNSSLYPIFLLLTTLVYWRLSNRQRIWLLILAGTIFYAYASISYAILLLLLTLIIFGLGQRGLNYKGKVGTGQFFVGIALAISILAVYKYSKFAIGSWNALSDWMHFPRFDVPQITVPLAISFFTFEFVHYLADLRARKISDTDLPMFLSFILFFPSMVAGPIKRYQHYAQQAYGQTAWSWDLFAQGITRIVLGYAEKIVVADSMNPFVAPLSDPTGSNVSALWLASYAYSIKILFDFSGYSDIAIGSAMLLGFRLPENFNWPYLAKNISEFWRRWHMSLSSWFRDYLFIPLGGNRAGRLRTAVNLLVVMLVSGLWHGAAWHFVAWGLWHGIGMMFYRSFRWLWPSGIPLGSSWLTQVSSVMLTFHFVLIGWVFFAVPSVTSAFYALRKMFLVG